MSNPDLSPDSEAQADWEKLPKNSPSRHALPPMTGGGNMLWLWVILLIMAILIIFGLLQGRMG
ncbi:MAG: hypothetical protein H0X30_36100 [Anaerolineae bacterium]|nr:hypothetical protein [Anaerolineae bacterium]